MSSIRNRLPKMKNCKCICHLDKKDYHYSHGDLGLCCQSAYRKRKF